MDDIRQFLRSEAIVICSFLVTNIVNETLLTNFLAFFNLGLTVKNRLFDCNGTASRSFFLIFIGTSRDLARRITIDL